MLFIATARKNPLPVQFRWFLYMSLKMAAFCFFLLIAVIFSAPTKDFSNSVSDGLFGMLLVSTVANIAGVYLVFQAYRQRTIDWIYRSEVFSAIYAIWMLALFAFTIVAHALIDLLGANIFLITWIFVVLLTSFLAHIANVYICRVIMERMMDGEEVRDKPPMVVEANPVRGDRADTIPISNDNKA